MTNIDIIGFYCEETEHHITLSDILVVYIDTNPDSMTQTMYLYPWLPLGVAANPKQEVKISKAQVNYIVDTDETVNEYFESMWRTFSEELDEKNKKAKNTTKIGDNVFSINKPPVVH
jgi:hypothetical protein